MPKKLDIDLTTLITLKNKGWSNKKLAKHFDVSEISITRKLKEDPVNVFAGKMMELLDDVPNDYCRKELLRSVNLIRTYRNSNDDDKKKKIINSIRSEACEIEEICDDTGLERLQVLDFLDELISENIVIRKERGGRSNRGRKIKYQYFLTMMTSVVY